MTTLWVDASSGASGDMLLGALVGAGVPVELIQAAVDAVSPEPVALRVEAVTRNGFAATRVHVEVADSEHHRSWRDIRTLLLEAPLYDEVRDLALRVFERLAVAEGAVHGHDPLDVHFHEVGALDAIADVVGVCAGFVHLARRRGRGHPDRRGLRHRPRRARHPARAAARGRRAAHRCPVVRRPARAHPPPSCAPRPVPPC